MATRAKTRTVEGGRMLGYSEVAERLGVSRAMVSRMVTTGVLPSVRSGPRAVRVLDHVLEEFISKGGISSTEGKARRDP